jgi:hypothetical protein
MQINFLFMAAYATFNLSIPDTQCGQDSPSEFISDGWPNPSFVGSGPTAAHAELQALLDFQHEALSRAAALGWECAECEYTTACIEEVMFTGSFDFSTWYNGLTGEWNSAAMFCDCSEWKIHCTACEPPQ